jgi:hypothetical protein
MKGRIFYIFGRSPIRSACYIVNLLHQSTVSNNIRYRATRLLF